MRLCNYSLSECTLRLKNRNLILFGMGSYCKYYVQEHFPLELVDNIAYIVDNHSPVNETEFQGKRLKVRGMEALKEEKECSVIITSSNYMWDMYSDLDALGLSDDVDCYFFPLVLATSYKQQEQGDKEVIFDASRSDKIEKTIHSFWFSGDKKPVEYQQCIDSWKNICPEYRIKEWNMDNYDWEKHPFMASAIRAKKWAFASDYARLDVLYHQGGIYMDMDVEIVKPLDRLLGNRAFFTFDANHDIDLGICASEAGNPLMLDLMQLYDGIEFEGSDAGMIFLCQPRLIRSVLKKKGLHLNGEFQVIDGNVFLPRKYLTPKDFLVYEMGAFCEDTMTIHHFNAGWKPDSFREKRIDNNRKLLEKMRSMAAENEEGSICI